VNSPRFTWLELSWAVAPPESRLPVRLLVLIANVPEGCRRVPINVSDEREAELTDGKFQITLAAPRPLSVTVWWDSESAPVPVTLMTTTAPAGAVIPIVEAACNCASVRLKTSVPVPAEVSTRAVVPVAESVVASPAMVDEAAARSDCVVVNWIGRELCEGSCVNVPPEFADWVNVPTYSPLPWARFDVDRLLELPMTRVIAETGTVALAKREAEMLAGPPYATGPATLSEETDVVPPTYSL
jgi:hypothetical protein